MELKYFEHAIAHKAVCKTQLVTKADAWCSLS